MPISGEVFSDREQRVEERGFLVAERVVCHPREIGIGDVVVHRMELLFFALDKLGELIERHRFRGFGMFTILQPRRFTIFGSMNEMVRHRATDECEILHEFECRAHVLARSPIGHRRIEF